MVFGSILGLFLDDFSCFFNCLFEVVFLMIFYIVLGRSSNCTNPKIIDFSLAFHCFWALGIFDITTDVGQTLDLI